MAGKQKRGRSKHRAQARKQKKCEHTEDEKNYKSATKRRKVVAERRPHAVQKTTELKQNEADGNIPSSFQPFSTATRPKGSSLASSEAGGAQVNAILLERATKFVASLREESRCDLAYPKSKRLNELASDIENACAALGARMKKPRSIKQTSAEKEERIVLKGKIGTLLAAAAIEERLAIAQRISNFVPGKENLKRSRPGGMDDNKDAGDCQAPAHKKLKPMKKRPSWMGKNLEQELKSDGWVEERHNKHHVLKRDVIHEDENGSDSPAQQTLTLPCTPSGQRAIKNAKTQMNKRNQELADAGGRLLHVEGASLITQQQRASTFRFGAGASATTFSTTSATANAITVNSDGSSKRTLEDDASSSSSPGRQCKKRKLRPFPSPGELLLTRATSKVHPVETSESSKIGSNAEGGAATVVPCLLATGFGDGKVPRFEPGAPPPLRRRREKKRRRKHI